MNTNLLENQSTIVYEDGEIELKVSLERDTIWLTQKQIAELFDKDVRTVNEHINTIYKEEELYENSTIRNFRIVQKEGKREVSRIDIFIEQNNLQIKEGIFYNGQIYDAYAFVNDLLKSAESEVILIDNSEIYHIGASLKDLGNKVFAFSKLNIDINSFELLKELN